MLKSFIGDGVASESAANTASGKPHLAWWCKKEDLRVASVRMRAALLMPMLAQQGIASTWFRHKDVSHYRCVVVSNRYDDETVSQLRWFKQNGGRLVLDLCDNEFLPRSQQKKHLHQVQNLRLLAALADVIVTVSEPLAQIVTRECTAAARIEVIGDVPDSLTVVRTNFWRRYWDHRCLTRERDHLTNAAPAGVARLVWFGNSGGRRQLSGMETLAQIAPMIANLSQTYPLHLTVISNSVDRYRERVASVLASSRYIEWSAATFDSLLHLQHIVLIPSLHNDFTACKSDNRVVTALRAGLAVVAGPVPSYAAYRDVIMLGDMEAGLRHYLRNPARRAADARRGHAQVSEAVRTQQTLAQWLNVCALQGRGLT